MTDNTGSTDTISLRSADGHCSELRIFRCGNEHAPVVMIFPAMGVAARNYDQLATALSKNGFTAVTAELRGLGSSSIRAAKNIDFGYAELIEKDIPATLERCRTLFPNAELLLFGHSLGGQLASLYLARDQTATAKLILCASCSVYFRGWQFPANLVILIFTQMAWLTSSLCGYFPGHKIGFGGRAARSVIADWARNARTGRYQLTGSDIDYERKLKTVDTTVLAINFANDRFAPLRATQRLVSKFGSSKAHYVAISATQLGAAKADHFSFLQHPNAVAVEIDRWYQSSNH